RHFRTGFAKTTQLLASELFDLLRLRADSPKLVSFSDSRQDAAKAALDIESRHHEDVRREVLVRALRALRDQRPRVEELDEEIARLREERKAAFERDDNDALVRVAARMKELEAIKRQAADESVRLGDVLEDPLLPRFLGARSDPGAGGRDSLKPLIAAFASL